MDRLVVFMLLQMPKILPPHVESTGLQNKLEPRRQRLVEFRNFLLEVGPFDPLHGTDLGWVRPHVDVFLEKQDVIDLVLAPNAVASVTVVDSCQIVEVFRAHL